MNLTDRLKEAAELLVVFGASLLLTTATCVKHHLGGSCGNCTAKAQISASRSH